MGEERVQELIRAAQAGDGDVREALLEEHRAWAEQLARRSRWGPNSGPDGDELSIALLGLNEAIDAFRPGSASFRSFAYIVINNRLRDHYRREARHRVVSLDDVGGHDDDAAAAHPAEVAASWTRYRDEEAARERALELAQYRRALQVFGVKLEELPDLAPQHADTRMALISVATVLAGDEGLRTRFLASRQVPLSALTRRVTLSRKTLKRWRPFIVAVALVFAHPEWEQLNGFFHGKRPQGAGIIVPGDSAVAPRDGIEEGEGP